MYDWAPVGLSAFKFQQTRLIDTTHAANYEQFGLFAFSIFFIFQFFFFSFTFFYLHIFRALFAAFGFKRTFRHAGQLYIYILPLLVAVAVVVAGQNVPRV